MTPALALWFALEPGVFDAGSRIGLSWESPNGCPSAPEVRDRIDAYLGHDEFGEELDDVVVHGVVRALGRAKGWELSINVDLPRGIVERRIASARCEDLRDAAALIIAVALDPLRISQRVAPPVAVVPRSTVVPAASPTPARRLFADIRVGGALEVGAAPRISGGPWLAVALVGRRFRAELASRWSAPVALRPFEAPSRAGVSVQSGIVAARGCFVTRIGPLQLPSCAQLEAGAWRGDGIGLDAPRRSHRAWVAVAVGQELVWHSRRRAGLWLAADAVLTVVRPRFVVDDLGTVLTPGWATLRMVAGASVRI